MTQPEKLKMFQAFRSWGRFSYNLNSSCMKNRSILLWIAWFALAAGCTRQNPTPNLMFGTWKIQGMIPAAVESDTVKSVNEMLALFLSHDDLTPNTLSISATDLVLRSAGGDSTAYECSIIASADNRYTIRTSEGEGTFVIGPGEGATLKIAGATYELKR